LDLHSRIEQLRALASRYGDEGLELLDDASIGTEIRSGVRDFLKNELDPEAASEYLVEAARLLQQLGREVMPLDRDRATSSTEEQDELDLETEFIEKLVEYRRFKELAMHLGTSREEFSKTYPRGTHPEDELAPELRALQGIELAELVRAFEKLLEEAAEDVTQRVVPQDELTVVQGRRRLTSVLREKGGEGSFQALFANGNRMELVVTFLALLELMREGAVVIHQSEQFGDIGVRLVEEEARQ